MTSIPQKMVAIHQSLDDAGIPRTLRRGARARLVHPARPRHHRHRPQRVRRYRPHGRGARRAARRRDLDRRRQRASRRRRPATPLVGVDAGRRLPEHHRLPRSGRGPGPLGAVRRDRAAVPRRAPTWPCSRRSSTAPRTGPTSRRSRDAGTLDVDRVVGVLVRYLGADDPRIARLLALQDDPRER